MVVKEDDKGRKWLTKIGANDIEFVNGTGWFNVPSDIYGIGSNVADGIDIKYICIPTNVEIIGEKAFKDHKSLECVIVHEDKNPEDEKQLKIEDEAFSGCSNLGEIYISKRTTLIGAWAFCDCEKLYLSEKSCEQIRFLVKKGQSYPSSFLGTSYEHLNIIGRSIEGLRARLEENKNVLMEVK